MVARHFGAAGFVTIARGHIDASRYGGRFQMYGDLADDEWRIVALAGAVAESIDDDPGVEAASVIAALRAEPTLLSGVDAQLAAGFVDADVERCLRIVRTLWHQIAREAGGAGGERVRQRLRRPAQRSKSALAFEFVPGGVVGSPGVGRLVNGGLAEDSVAAANGGSWRAAGIEGIRASGR